MEAQRMEPNRRCSVQKPGSTARADGRDSGSSSRFSSILRSMRAAPASRHWHRAAIPDASERRAMASSPFPLRRFPLWLSAMGDHPTTAHRSRPDPGDARGTAPSRRSGSATVAAQRREKRNSACACHGSTWPNLGPMVPSRFQPNARMACAYRWLVRRRHCPYRHAVQWLG